MNTSAYWPAAGIRQTVAHDQPVAGAGQRRSRRDPVDRPVLKLLFSSMVVSLVEQLEPVASVKRITIKTAAQNDVHVRGDASWIERVVLNLLDNAIKFTLDGGNVTVSLAAKDAEAALNVQDNGIGIPAEALPHIFRTVLSRRTFALQADRRRGSGIGASPLDCQKHRRQSPWKASQAKGAVSQSSFHSTAPLTHRPYRRYPDTPSLN